MHASMTRRDLFVFLGTLFALTWAVQIVAILQVGDLNQPGAVPYLLACMFLPTVWTLAWLWRRPKLRQAFRWRFGNPLYSLLGALFPAGLALAALLAVVGLGWGTSSNFALSSASVEVLQGPWQLGLGAQSWPFFLVNFALTGVVFGVVNASTAVGEEIGWRGLLQGPMIERWGVLGGVTILGLVWAFWHLPANLAGYNFGETPLLGAFVLFPLQLVADSFLMAWLTRRADSFWPAAFYHGSGNGILQSVAHATMQPSVPRLWLDLLVVAVTLAAGTLAAWALVREGPSRQVPGTLGALPAA
jgi:uncharacterized protein